MERSHTPLSIWFWAAYLVASQTPGMSAVQFQRQLGLSRYETAFGILHKLRAGMVRPDQDRIGGTPAEHVEVDETWVGGRTRGEGRGVHHKVLVVGAVEVRHRKPGTAQDKRKDGRYAGRVRLAVAARPQRRDALRIRRERRHAGDVGRHGRLERLRQPAERAAMTITPSPNVAIRKWPRSSCPSSISSSRNLKTWLTASITASARSTCKLTSTSSPSDSTGASTRSTPSARLLGIAGDVDCADFRRALFRRMAAPYI